MSERIQIPYSELYYARLFSEKLLSEHEKDYHKSSEILEKIIILHGIDKDETIISLLDSEDLSYYNELKNEIIRLESLIEMDYEHMSKIDNRFMQQIRFISHQIDTNFPIV